MSVEAEKMEARSSVKDTVRVIIHALILALIVRIFLFQPFNIPSGSMIPTLLIGDYLFVSKYSYGYSRYSIPFGLDLFSGRIWAKEPDRGDVVVFKLPRDNETDYIKRVIGLPGDEIQMVHGVLNINGNAVPKVRVDDFVVTEPSGRERHMPRYMETLPNGVIVVDYKAGADEEGSGRAQRSANESLQLRLYALAHERVYGERPIQTVLHYLESGERGTVAPTEDSIGAVRGLISGTASRIRAREFAPNPKGLRTCQQCPYHQICPSSLTARSGNTSAVPVG